MNERSCFKTAAVSALVSAIASAGAHAGQITLYDDTGFKGQRLATTEAIANLQTSGLNRPASSIVIADGRWEACTEANFRGRCAVFAPGVYNSLGADFSGTIASVRELVPGNAQLTIIESPAVASASPAPVVINQGGAQVVVNADGSVVVNSDARHPAVVRPRVIADGPITIAPSVTTVPAAVGAPAVATVPGDTRIVLYEHTWHGDRSVELTSSVEDLDHKHFENRANAAFVAGGVWRLCDHERGRGQCSDFSPGRYDSLGALDRKVSSAYIVAPAPDVVSGYAPTPIGRLVLYQYPNFGGNKATVEAGRAPDLDWAGFRERATSLRIDSGTWLVCSDIGYQGECRVIGPGSYPQLAGVLKDGVSSARQIPATSYSAAYPYVVSRP